MDEERILEDARRLRGKVVAVTDCQLGDGTDDGYRGVSFRRKDPLFIVIDPSLELNPHSDVCWYDVEDLADTLYEAEALPRQLGGGDYVSWVYGPTYHEDGGMEEPWVAHPLCDWLNGLSPVRREDFLRTMRETTIPACELLAEWGGKREWARHFGLKAQPLQESED